MQADGSFVLYYSASVDNLHHCVGAATSKNVEGPYKAVATALACPSPTGYVPASQGTVPQPFPHVSDLGATGKVAPSIQQALPILTGANT